MLYYRMINVYVEDFNFNKIFILLDIYSLIIEEENEVFWEVFFLLNNYLDKF